MDTKALTLFAVGIVAFIIAYRTGNVTKAILISTFFGSIPVLPLILFLGPLALLAITITSISSAAGCFIGILLYRLSAKKPNIIKPLWVYVGVTILAIGVFSNFKQTENNDARWDEIGETTASNFVEISEKVATQAGEIRFVTMSSKGKDSAGNHLYNYTVRGTKGNKHVGIKVTGTIENPVFTILFIEAN